MLTQLETPIPLQTPKGKAWAVAIIDYGPHWDLLWVTFIHDSGECWTFNNSEIRQEKNYTFGITGQSPIVTGTGKNPYSLSADTSGDNGQHHPKVMRSALNGSHKTTN